MRLINKNHWGDTRILKKIRSGKGKWVTRQEKTMELRWAPHCFLLNHNTLQQKIIFTKYWLYSEHESEDTMQPITRWEKWVDVPTETGGLP